MKRILIWLIAMILLCTAVMGCQNPDIAKSDAFDGVPLEAILDNIYQEADIKLPLRGTTRIKNGNASYYLGSDEIAFADAIASDAMMSVIPFSLCLVRVADKADAEATAAAILESADPNKWICVGLSGDCVVADYAGDVVILIMAEEAEALHAAFCRLAAAGSDADLQMQ